MEDIAALANHDLKVMETNRELNQLRQSIQQLEKGISGLLQKIADDATKERKEIATHAATERTALDGDVQSMLNKMDTLVERVEDLVGRTDTYIVGSMEAMKSFRETLENVVQSMHRVEVACGLAEREQAV